MPDKSTGVLKSYTPGLLSQSKSKLEIRLTAFLILSVQTQTETTRIWFPCLTPVWPSAFGSPHATFWAGPAVVTATRTGWELAWLCSAARPHYTAAGFDVVCEALPALLQPVALPPGNSSSCQQVSVLPLISPRMRRVTHTCTHIEHYRLASGQSPDANMHVHACTNTRMKWNWHQSCRDSIHTTSSMLQNVHKHTPDVPISFVLKFPINFLTRVSSMLANNCWGSLGISPTHLQVPNGFIIWKEFIVIIWYATLITKSNKKRDC